MGRVNIKVTEDVHEQHNERRKELGLSWTEYMRKLEYSPSYEHNSSVDYSEIAKQTADEVEERLR